MGIYNPGSLSLWASTAILECSLAVCSKIKHTNMIILFYEDVDYHIVFIVELLTSGSPSRGVDTVKM